MQRYPLTWPTGWRRFPPNARKRAKFNSQGEVRMGTSVYHRRAQVTVCDAVERVFAALSKMGIIDAFVTISSNLQLRNDGLPRSGQPEPSDPGVAVYWREPLSDARKVMAIDRYERCADNLAAIAASLEAMRAIERLNDEAPCERERGAEFIMLVPPMLIHISQAMECFANAYWTEDLNHKKALLEQALECCMGIPGWRILSHE